MILSALRRQHGGDLALCGVPQNHTVQPALHDRHCFGDKGPDIAWATVRR
jgi:hypothetical protein